MGRGLGECVRTIYKLMNFHANLVEKNQAKKFIKKFKE